MIPRPANPADLPAIAALHVANWRRDYAGLLPDAVLAAPLDEAMARKWQARALEGPLRVHVAGEGAAISGFVAFDLVDADGVHVDALHVAQGARGCGLGAALMRGVADLARGRSVWLEVLAGNSAARAVYAGWGGVEGPVFVDSILGVSLPAHRVEWPDGAALAARLEARAAR
ncbi:GNAT family N-acetyltransferase [Roseicyclus marinus]|uniref:GNAT family N-acetyltransferase n=1 Tax=Roseicyclus marinus TaxID=2161673 RepID=UPI00240F247E|nr:GNAT family N-acetyltransferase [Roseicyclus marinus]MDG3042702.1 GNAT family N-acetyltransferase [Roseicyclus marinus]